MRLCAGSSMIAAVWLAMASPVAAQQGDLQADGLVASRAQIVISSQITAPILSMPVRAGHAFAKGDLLVEFDCAVLEAERDAQVERQAAADQNFATASRLGRSGAVAKGEVIVAESEAKIAAADLRAIQAQLRGCRIYAPFDGHVVETFASTFENVGQTQEVIEIVDSGGLEVELIVPSNWLKWMRVGTEFEFEVFETGEVHKAVVETIGAVVDPVSRTVEILASFSGTPKEVLPGMTGVASFRKQSGQ